MINVTLETRAGNFMVTTL